MNAPEAYIQFTPGLITDDGEITVPSTEQFLRSFMENYAAFIARVLSVLPRDAGNTTADLVSSALLNL